MCLRLVVAAVITVVQIAAPALGDTGYGKDLQLLSRSLGFIENIPADGNKLVIVYDPANSHSLQQAQEIKAAIGPALKSRNRSLIPTLSKIDELSSQTNVGALFLTSGLGTEAKVSALTKSDKIVCSTFDLLQVKNGHCLIGVQSEPKVEIIVSKSYADAIQVEFDPAFRMLITLY
jgi:hypothetical protein